jgi:hypothetical protein
MKSIKAVEKSTKRKKKPREENREKTGNRECRCKENEKKKKNAQIRHDIIILGLRVEPVVRRRVAARRK